MFIKLGLLLTLIIMPFVLNANTGSLDYRGAHNCWINCEERGLYQGEYHIHHGSRQYFDEHRGY